MKTESTRISISEYSKLLLNFHREWFGGEAWRRLGTHSTLDGETALREFSFLGMFRIVSFLESSLGKSSKDVLGTIFQNHFTGLQSEETAQSSAESVVGLMGERLQLYDRVLNSKDGTNGFVLAIANQLGVPYLEAGQVFQYWVRSGDELKVMRGELELALKE